ncbi:MAG: DUF559 domain-containing protein [Actinobacteria bacterium]|nr:MAG: DUF559 domain-containing protein [Actinomycetota bacterium]
MRRIFTADESGLTRATLRWGERERKWIRVERGIYLEGGDPPSKLDLARARVLAARTIARGTLAGVLHGLDSVTLGRKQTCEDLLLPSQVTTVGGVPCADGLTTLVDLAGLLSDTKWEHALESTLRKRLTWVTTLEAALPELSSARTPGTKRMRRVLALRPPGAAPTESLLETLMVQLARDIPGLPPPVRQFTVYDARGEFVARVDLCWPQLGLFIELDGQHHPGQPVYDARRETAVVAATGWLVGRFTWYEVVQIPKTTVRRLTALVDQAGRRPLPQSA